MTINPVDQWKNRSVGEINLRDRHQNMLWCACRVRTTGREQSHWEDPVSQCILLLLLCSYCATGVAKNVSLLLIYFLSFIITYLATQILCSHTSTPLKSLCTKSLQIFQLNSRTADLSGYSITRDSFQRCSLQVYSKENWHLALHYSSIGRRFLAGIKWCSPGENIHLSD